MNILHTQNPTRTRDVFIYLFILGTLFASVWNFITLIFAYIDKLVPDALTYGDPLYNDVKFGMSTLIVAFPIYVFLTRFMLKDVIANPEKREFGFRKFVSYLTLFLAGVTMVVDVITLLNSFFDGDLTTRFILKVLAVFIVAGGVFAYYLWDLKRELKKTTQPNRIILWGTSAVVCATIVAGFFVVGSPAAQRARRFDERRINDLSTIESQITAYWQQNKKLPESLVALGAAFQLTLPTDPETQLPYDYTRGENLSYSLCARFEMASNTSYEASHPYTKPVPQQFINWDHPAGTYCFARKIDPALFLQRAY